MISDFNIADVRESNLKNSSSKNCIEDNKLYISSLDNLAERNLFLSNDILE